MKRTDREDAVARALDLLPTDDPARSDPRIVRDVALFEEARAAREIAADVWLAVSPLRAAPPDVLHSVMGKIGLPVTASQRRQRFVPWIAASGWAAAAVVAVSLWPDRPQQRQPEAVAGQGTGTTPSFSGNAAEPLAPSPQENPTRERQQRDELMRLRNLVADLREEQSVSAPRVMSLSVPGSIQRTPEETQERVSAVLVGGLRRSLVTERGPGGGPPALIIEGEWLPDGFVLPNEETVLMHPSFPEDSWQAYGLRRSDEGNYYDPAHQILWVPDPVGTGFLGKKVPEAKVDLAAYKVSSEMDEEPKIASRSEPEGFVIEDRVSKKAEVIIDQVPAPEEGNKQVLKWTDASGNSGELDVGTVAATASNIPEVRVTHGSSTITFPNGITTLSAASTSQLLLNSSTGMGTYMISASVACSSSLASFELVEVPIVKDSKPRRVIVSGGRRRAR